MKCTRCGYIRQKNDDFFIPANECPSCGMIYKTNADNISGFAMDADGSDPPRRTSPVDAESLKKARQRVEKRLQERLLAAHKRNSHHAQTLELARQFASEGVRKRQEQWKQQQAAQQKGNDSSSDPSAENMTRANMTINAKEDATDVGTTFSEVLNMEAEPEDTIQKSWLAPSQEKSATALSDADSESEPDWDDSPQANDVLIESGLGHQRKRWRWAPGGRLMRLLPLAAWLILVAGISGAFLSWTTLTEAAAGMQPRQMVFGNSIHLGLLLGFAYLVTGVLGFAFFWVSSLISRELKDIHQLLLLQPIPKRW